jgi:hypothetical protein
MSQGRQGSDNLPNFKHCDDISSEITSAVNFGGDFEVDYTGQGLATGACLDHPDDLSGCQLLYSWQRQVLCH